MRVDPRAVRAPFLLVFLLSAFPSVAAADWLLVPFVGGTFAGSTAVVDPEQGASSTQIVFGASAGWLGAGILGVESDFAYAPRYFEKDNIGGIVTDSNAITWGGAVLVAMPVSVSRESLRPYFVGGLGWMHASLEVVQNPIPEILGRARNSVAMNLGGGAIGFITARTGVRFEVRHFRSLEREENPFTLETASLLSFWRATVGVVIRR